MPTAMSGLNEGLTTANEYRRLAEECATWARDAENDAERHTFLLMARDWTGAADRLKPVSPAMMPGPNSADMP
jgi:hypothetical protein